jgi:peptide/nickel transport system ATP-binding protein
MSAAPLLSVENLQTVFRTDKEIIRAVDGIDIQIRSGEVVGLVGESGSGKSVTARSIMGLVEEPGEVLPDSSIKFEGRELLDVGWDDARGDISIIFQDHATSLNPVYTVGNQIKEALRIHQGMRGSEAEREAIDLLEQVGIPDASRRVDEYPHQFSGGMRQRAVISIALACDPNLLICDEPTTALDVTIQAQILELLKELQETEDLAIMFITHDMGVIEEIADRVNVMYAGEIIERAPVEDLFENPEHPYTQGLLASIPGRTSGGDRLPTIEGEVPTPTAAAEACRFAPRCPKAFEACEKRHPEAVSVGNHPDHEAACLLYDDRFADHAPDDDEVAFSAGDTAEKPGGDRA